METNICDAISLSSACNEKKCLQTKVTEKIKNAIHPKIVPFMR